MLLYWGKSCARFLFAKDLGVHMDATLSFDDYTKSVSSSCLSSSCQINRAKHLFYNN